MAVEKERGKLNAELAAEKERGAVEKERGKLNAELEKERGKLNAELEKERGKFSLALEQQNSKILKARIVADLNSHSIRSVLGDYSI